MYHLLNLALVSLLVMAARSQEPTSELCQLDPTLSQNLCTYVRMCSRSNRIFSNQLRNSQRAIDETSFSFREPVNVTSLDCLYVELLQYVNTLQSLGSSLRAYMTTSQYADESQLNSVASFANNYLERTRRIVGQLERIAMYLQASDHLTSTTVTPAISGTAVSKNQGEIYAEGYYVSNKMGGLLQAWLPRCVCGSTRLRRAVRGN